MDRPEDGITGAWVVPAGGGDVGRCHGGTAHGTDTSSSPRPTVTPATRPAFERVAIVNRGEPAMRLIHAVAELRHERGWPLRTIALHGDVDRGAWFVREADETACIGPAAVADAATGPGPTLTWTWTWIGSMRRWPGAGPTRCGWGGASWPRTPPSPSCAPPANIRFIGPPPAAMRLLGDTVAARRLARAVGAVDHAIPAHRLRPYLIEAVERGLARHR